MEEKKKKKSGNDYLKEKIAKLEEERDMLKLQRATASAKAVKLQEDLDEEVREHQALERRYIRLKDELNGVIDKQKTTISQLSAELSCKEKAIEENAYRTCAIMDEMMRFMGPIRRWFFYHKHKEGVL